MQKIKETVASATNVNEAIIALAKEVETKVDSFSSLTMEQDEDFGKRAFKLAHEFYMSLDEEKQNELKESIYYSIDNDCIYGENIDMEEYTSGDLEYLDEIFEVRRSICEVFVSLNDGEEPTVGAMSWWNEVLFVVGSFIENMQREEEMEKLKRITKKVGMAVKFYWNERGELKINHPQLSEVTELKNKDIFAVEAKDFDELHDTLQRHFKDFPVEVIMAQEGGYGDDMGVYLLNDQTWVKGNNWWHSLSDKEKEKVEDIDWTVFSKKVAEELSACNEEYYDHELDGLNEAWNAMKQDTFYTFDSWSDYSSNIHDFLVAHGVDIPVVQVVYIRLVVKEGNNYIFQVTTELGETFHPKNFNNFGLAIPSNIKYIEK